MTTLTSSDLENAPETCDESTTKSQEEQQTDDMAAKKTDPSKFHVRRHTRSSAGFVNLHEGSPLPPVYALWRSHRSEEAREWEEVVADRIRLFQPFLPESHTTGDIIRLD
ncbi:hypothetical protein RIF29_25245 [Crotalaria pallida]|uniref:Uncharacterized protein n=1 Tax=Crotalaria pallida TaxID=3830 RepID=A0AAN9EM11_CROPI